MARISFESSNKKVSSNEYPRLSLEKGERARIVLIEDAPHMEWVNTLRAPALLPGGVPEYETIRTRTGEERQVIKYNFVGQHISIGDPAVIAEKGYDEADPVGAAGYRGEYNLRPTERRFAMHVIRYKTKPGSFELQEPYQPELLVWRFGEKIFSQLVDYASEWGDLKMRDLLLGPCESKQFQKFDINVAAKAEWLETEERKQLTAEVYRNNRLDDLSITLGRRLSRDQILDDFEGVKEKYNIATGVAVAPTAAAAEVPDLGLDSLLAASSSSSAAPVPAAPVPAAPALADIPAPEAPAQAAPAQAAPAQAAPAQAAPAQAELSLDDLLNL
jgi:hypothetical protein